ncbi:hypothetical protein BDZ89DRAFT_1057875 [Hymenopellis radicata]|nr:hypothetical protein BDZ89DRAFT_1057875 [Hymenopellis radicata]
MSSLVVSASRTSMSTSSSYSNIDNGLAAPASASVSNLSLASSSNYSLDKADQENVTLKPKRASPKKEGKRRSEDDHAALLPALVVSSQMTATSLAIADIQARIFSIQELRHKSQESADTAGTTNTIDQSLMALDEKLESVSKDMKAITDAMEPLLQQSSTPTMAHNGESSETTMMLRKHATLISDWESVQDESDTLREELKEDKWLTVFRTVTDQADGMMSSLEKAVNRCQDFISSVYRHSTEDAFSHNKGRDTAPPNMELFTSLLDSYEAKKKHYMPATSKVLSIIDKGVRDRVTKNGETLRRHAESAQRWRNLRERISRIDTDMEAVRKYLVSGDTPSENGSSTGTGSTHNGNGYLVTPPHGSRSSRAPSAASTLSRSISPFRKFARKITGTPRQSNAPPPVTPLSVTKRNGSRTPSSEPPPGQSLRKQRTSIFNSIRVTPDRPSHKYSQSLTPDPSPRKGGSASKQLSKQRWNSSTKVENDPTVKGAASKRSPSAAGMYGDSVACVYDFVSSLLPMSSTASTNYSSNHPPMPVFRPPSRAQTPSRSFTPGPAPPTPRARPKTPSHIPAPSNKLRLTGNDDDDYFNSMRQGALSPTFSTSGFSASGSSPFAHPPRPPSRSMIPVPTVHLSSPSRPSTSLSSYGRSESPTMAFRISAARAQTPEATLRTRAQQVPVYQSGTFGRSSGRPSLNKLPPSSFRDGSSRAPSRSGSRAGAYTPSEYPLYEYTPSNAKDPLDVEVGVVVNSLAHGLLVERVDPPLKKLPKEGEEIKAQYAFSNQISKKVVTCRLTTMTRLGKGTTDTTKKVMCRVGGGWQDLSLYILNRQAGM